MTGGLGTNPHLPCTTGILGNCTALSNSNDKEQEMVSDGYTDHIRGLLSKLHLPTNKLRHLGRGTGTKELDGNEVNEQEIRRMGQWNQSVYDQSYSSKLPIAAMRSLAGFTTANGMYYNPRTAVMPSDELLRMTPIGAWSFDMLSQLENDTTADKPTATACLHWFKHLCVVFLQDLAAMSFLFPDCCKACALFCWMPVLQTSEFEKVMEEMKVSLGNEVDSLDASMEKVLPGVFMRFHGVDDKMDTVVRKVDGIYEHITKEIQSI
jgi:Centromere DNA-binding protein complex CBF3 subunit, domain 2